MRKIERMSPLALLAAAAIGAACGLLVQFVLSNRGNSPLVPPTSLTATLTLIALILLMLGVQLRRAVAKRPGAINPFNAVRLLAAARAGQLVGALLGGFAGGLLLSLWGRSVPAPAATWLPMVLALGSGMLLVACAIVTERLCQVPPGDDGADGSEQGDGHSAPSGGPADQAAFRRP